MKMGVIISINQARKEDNTALSVLADLKRRGIITAQEKERLEIELKNLGIVFSDISPMQKNLLFEQVCRHVAMSEDECRFAVINFQEMFHISMSNCDNLMGSCWRIQKYAESRERQIIPVVHALIVANC